jgi:hypothetical protein
MTTNKHQKVDQEGAVLGKYIHDSGRTFYPEMLPDNAAKLYAREAVDETLKAICNMTDMDRAERMGIHGKALRIIQERGRKLKPLGAVQLSIVARLTSALAKVTPNFTVYEHPSAPNVYLVYCDAEYVPAVGKAMVKWITDPAIPPYVAYQVQPFGSNPQ